MPARLNSAHLQARVCGERGTPSFWICCTSRGIAGNPASRWMFMEVERIFPR